MQQFLEGGLAGLADRSHTLQDRAGRVPVNSNLRGRLRVLGLRLRQLPRLVSASISPNDHGKGSILRP